MERLALNLSPSSASLALSGSARDGLADDSLASEIMLDPLTSTREASVPVHTSVLSDEIWKSILLRMDYKTLGHARAVCKKFKQLLEVRCIPRATAQRLTLTAAPSFRRRLVSRATPEQLRGKQQYSLHPMPEVVDCGRVTRDVADITHWSKPLGMWDHEKFNAFDYPAAQEYATAPASTLIEIELDSPRAGQVYTGAA